jgi:hypothetical protein
VLRRSTPKRLKLTWSDRIFWVWLRRVWGDWKSALMIVKAETVIAWHRKVFRLFWTWRIHRGKPGRPKVPQEVRDLIRMLSRNNPRWGAPRVHGELLKLGIEITEPTVAKYMVRHRKPPSQGWRTFLENHVKTMVSVDFFTVPTIRFVFLVLAHERRRRCHIRLKRIAQRKKWLCLGRSYGELALDGISGCDDLVPGFESTLPFGLIVRSRKQMSFWSKVGCHDPVHLEKTLRMLGRLEALHPALPLPGRLMRVLRSVIEVPALPMSHSRQNHLLRGAVAAELIGNDRARPTSTALQQLPEEPHSSKPVPLGLHQNVDNGSFLIHGTPEIMLYSVDLQKHFIEEPLIAQLGSPSLQFGRIGCSERVAPAADRFVAQLNSSIGHYQFHFAQTD